MKWISDCPNGDPIAVLSVFFFKEVLLNVKYDSFVAEDRTALNSFLKKLLFLIKNFLDTNVYYFFKRVASKE